MINAKGNYRESIFAKSGTYVLVLYLLNAITVSVLYLININIEKRKVIIYDVAILNIHYVMETVTEKQQRYCELQQDIKKKLKLEYVKVFPRTI